MLFWMFLIITIVLVTIAILSTHFYWSDLIDVTCVLLGAASFLTVMVMLFIILVENIGAAGTQAALQEDYKAIKYKLETEAARDEFGLLNKEIVDEVQDWNSAISRGKALQKDLWLGIFYPNIYDDFETIELN